MSESAYFPVKQLEQYLGLRRNKNGRLFVYPNLLPISRSQFINSLKAALSFIGLSTSVYKGHSFRGHQLGHCNKGNLTLRLEH